MTHHLVGVAEVGEILGVSRQRAAQLAKEHADFPKPVVVLASGRVWTRKAIESWMAAHPERRPGRPRKENR